MFLLSKNCFWEDKVEKCSSFQGSIYLDEDSTVAHSLSPSPCSVGVVLSFYSNEQSFDTIESLQTTMNGIVGTAVDYINAFLDVRTAW